MIVVLGNLMPRLFYWGNELMVLQSRIQKAVEIIQEQDEILLVSNNLSELRIMHHYIWKYYKNNYNNSILVHNIELQSVKDLKQLVYLLLRKRVRFATFVVDNKVQQIILNLYLKQILKQNEVKYFIFEFVKINN